VFVALTTFDLAISSLLRLYGAQASKCMWWRQEYISLFVALAETYQSMKQDWLWFRLECSYAKQRPFYGELDRLINSESGTPE
jgi:hypothetical protein